MPFFSIITVVKNDYNGLLDTIKSINKQDFESFEWVLVDGASGDNTLDALNFLKCSVKSTVISEVDDGLYDAMNKGLLISSGEYVVFLNAGDVFFSKDILKRVSTCIADYDVLYGDSYEKSVGKKFYKKARGHKRIDYGMCACHQSFYIKKTVLMTYHFNISYKIAADYELVARIYMANHSFYYIEYPLVIFDSSGLSNVNQSLGRHENWKIQRDILKMNIFNRFNNKLKYLISSTIRKYVPVVYYLLRRWIL